MDWSNPATYAMIAMGLQTFGSFLNMFIPTNTKAGKIINALALGFGKAAPDPAKQ